MSEASGSTVVSNVLTISDLAAKVSVRLLALSRKIHEALKPIESLSKDIASTGAVLNQLGRQLQKDNDVSVGSATLVNSVEELVEDCSLMFDSIDKALDGNERGSKAILGLQEHVQVAALEPQLAVMESNLEKLKTPLMLMLQVLIYAEQLNSRDNQHMIQEQHQLIRQFNEERKGQERQQQKIDPDRESLPFRSTFDSAANRAAPVTPHTPSSGSSKGEVGPPRKRVWIREESPELAAKPRRVETPGASESRHSGEIPNRFERGTEKESPSLADMATFLRLGEDGLQTPQRSSEETAALPGCADHQTPRHEPRDPKVRGDCSHLISFFREGYSSGDKGSMVHAPRNFTLVQRGAAPMTPPLTGVDEDKTKSGPPQPVPPSPAQQPHLRSQSAGLPSPLGSHPPQRPFDPTRPATTKWPPQAVLAWLETNSFAVEWQRAFGKLQIWGSEFVELESGQSIRKMLTVIYPQIAKECSATGKAWDQDRERAEGQRLRRLIRELPVEIKYEDGSDAATDGMAVAPGDRKDMSGAAASRPQLARPTGRQRACTTPVEDRRTTFAAAAAQTNPQASRCASRRGCDGPSEEDLISLPEEGADGGHAQSLGHVRHGSEVSDLSDASTEWVRKWSVLAPEEGRRGGDGGALMI